MGIVKVSRYPLSPFELPKRKSRPGVSSSMAQKSPSAMLVTTGNEIVCSDGTVGTKPLDSTAGYSLGENQGDGLSEHSRSLLREDGRSVHTSSRPHPSPPSQSPSSPSDTCRSIFSLYYFKSKSRIQILKQLHLIARIRCKPKSCRMLRRGLAPHLNLIDYNPPHTESIMFI